MGCCLRLVFFALWRAVFAAIVAIVLARIDAYVASSGKTDTMAGRAWRMYRSRSGKRGGPSSRRSTDGGPST